MEKILSGDRRRQKIISLISGSGKPLSGTELGRLCGVSRQVIVQDIALIRSAGTDIVSTARGYIVSENKKSVRLFKVCHTDDQIEEELDIIVDLGGTVVDVFVNHRTYGKMSGELNIKCRKDVKAFLSQIESGKSSPLLNVTSGYHFHHIAAESEKTLDEIQQALEEKKFLAQVLPYEEELSN